MKLFYGNLSDNELIKLVKDKKDDNAFNTLLKRYEKLINGKAYQYFKSNYSSLEFNDIKQEVVLAFYSAVLTFDVNQNNTLTTYASRCIDNRIINVMKAEKNFINKVTSSNIIEYSLSSDENMIDVESSPEELLIKKDTIEQLIDIINKFLTQNEKDVLIYKLRGLSYEEISKIMNISKKDVDNLYTSIKRKIKSKLGRR